MVRRLKPALGTLKPQGLEFREALGLLATTGFVQTNELQLIPGLQIVSDVSIGLLTWKCVWMKEQTPLVLPAEPPPVENIL